MKFHIEQDSANGWVATVSDEQLGGIIAAAIVQALNQDEDGAEESWSEDPDDRTEFELPGYYETCQEHNVAGRLCAFIHVSRLPHEVLAEALRANNAGDVPGACKVLRSHVPGLGIHDSQAYVVNHLVPDAGDFVPDVRWAVAMSQYGRQIIAQRRATFEWSPSQATAVSVFLDMLTTWAAGDRL